MNSRYLRSLLTLLAVPGVGAESIRTISQRCGSFEHFVDILSGDDWKDLPLPNPILREALKDDAACRMADRIMDGVDRERYAIVTWWDEHYPFRLREIHRPPLVLFYRNSNPVWDFARTVAIVGTRKATDYGRQAVRTLMEGLVRYRPIIISGLAFGIDAWAHELALEMGLPTVGVLGHGFDHFYPAAHRKLADRMVVEGGDVITEFFPWERPERYHFPQRNRIIAGLADMTVVVESRARGGAMLTAELAFSFNREVGAVPGLFNAETAVGPHRLIQRQMAHLITSAEDIAHVMGWSVVDVTPQQRAYRPESKQERYILRALTRKADLTLDELAAMTSMDAAELASCILNLEFQRVIENVRGQTYRLIAQVDLS